MVILLDAKTLIQMAAGYANISNNELARRLGWSSQVMSNRLKTGKFSLEEWQSIATALGADAETVISFTFPDGKRIS